MRRWRPFTTHRGDARREEAAFVLPAVLAVLIVVAGVAALATQRIATWLTVTSSRANLVRLQGMVDGVARTVAFGLLAEHTRRLPGFGLPENGAPVACPLGPRGTVQVSVQDQGGLIDLNASPRLLMEDAFRALGVDDHDAATIAAEIVDYRDFDDDPEPGGAEAAQYKARGLPYGPRNAPMTSIEELDLLPSMTEEIAAKIRPALTVYNPRGGIDTAMVPVTALVQSVPGETVRQHAMASPHRFYEVRVVANDVTGAQAGRGLMLSAGGDGTDPGVFAWRNIQAGTPAGGTSTRICDALVGLLEQ